MKAISRLLILFTLLACGTGFGLTITDLSQNSENDIVIYDHVDNVSFEMVNYNFDLNVQESYEAIFKRADKSQAVAFENHGTNLKSIDDVGWRNQKQNLNKKIKRNPRDGLTQR